jgi:ABC-type multidrug transport system ATPase subunit
MIHTLEADNIQLTYNDKKILSDIYLKCETGSITGLLGRNGSGKSSLMQVIYGNLKCDKSVRINNTPIKELFKRPRSILYLPQFNFIPKGLSIKRVFKDFELSFSDFETRFPEFARTYNYSIGHLSGGERRFVELFVIVHSNSQFMLLDEPFTHLNPIQIEKTKSMFLAAKKCKGLLITDHMFKHVTEVCDNIYVLVNGKTHLTKSVEEIESLGYARL